MGCARWGGRLQGELSVARIVAATPDFPAVAIASPAAVPAGSAKHPRRRIVARRCKSGGTWWQSKGDANDERAHLRKLSLRQVELQIVGPPVLRALCYCTSCQQAGRRHQAIPGADAVLAEDGGTDFVLYRKDRVRCVRGGDLLEERRLTPGSPTRRMYARCCNTAMVLDYTRGHWLTIYRGRLPDNIPPAALRMMTAERPEGVILPDDIASYPGFPGKFMLKLLLAWMAMGFRRPAVDGVPQAPALPNGS